MNKKVKIGIIGGTGIYKLPGIENLEQKIVHTEYGDVTVNIGTLSGKMVAFLTRHGEHHSTSPGQINYRANIRAMQLLGVKQLFATACSGSLNPEYKTGGFVLIKQFLDFTKNREASFYDNDGTVERKIAHADVTHPYCDRMGNIIIEAGKKLGVKIESGAVYCCTEGPRFETDAEVKMLRILGGDLVAQTQYPEVVLAREAEMCYAAVGIIANMAAGIEDEHVSALDMKIKMSAMFETVQGVLAKSVELIQEDEDCWCKHALNEAYL